MSDRDYLLGSNIQIMREIIRQTCIKYNVSPKEMIGNRRSRYIAWPRQEAYYRCSKETCASLPEIGRVFGDRDHTTIAHGIKRHTARLGEPMNNSAIEINLDELTDELMREPLSAH